MKVLYRVLRLTAIVVWEGGLLFFAFVTAPVAFSVLHSAHDAGAVVRTSLIALNDLGYVCGLVFFCATVPVWLRARGGARRLVSAQMVLVAAMLAAIFWVQDVVVPRMERDRIAAGGDVDAAPWDNVSRLDFEHQHPLSERLEGAALIAGLVVVVLLGIEPPPIRSVEAQTHA